MEETRVTSENPVVPTRSRLRKVLRVLAVGGLVGILVLVTAHFAWTYSGSNEWKQEIDRNGIKVYSRKTPGAPLKDVKAVRRLKTRLMVAMAAMTEEGVENCSDWLPGCESARNVVPYDPRTVASTDLYVVRYPRPYSPREYLIKTQISQDPKSKSVLMVLTAVPDLIPRNECCYRVEDMDNRWRFTPVENGELEVEFLMHMNQGLPYMLVNRIAPQIAYGLLDDLPKHFGKKQYQTVKLDFIKE